ncbi:MAG: hypothetical protein VYE64_07800 [Planctomycetota bacterium]|nr:hypothetical protein [Planctomycetota bacterium]
MEQFSTADNPEALHQQLLRSFTDFELSFRRRFPIIWLVTLLAPFVVSIGLILFFGFTDSWSFSRKLIGHAFMTFFVFGRLIILCGLDSNAQDTYQIALSPAVLFGLVTYLDFMVALFVTFHMGFLFRIPYVGPKVAMLVWDGRFLLNAQPWVKRVAFFGLVVFVIFPTSTTGSIGGSIFGRLLGLSRYMTVLGILIGSFIGNGIMYLFAKQINQYITPDNVWLKVVGVLALVGLVALVEIRYRFVKRKYIAAAESRVEEMQHAESRESTVERSTEDDPAARQDPDES